MEKTPGYISGEKCPITDLPYSSSSQWQNVKHSFDLSSSFYLIGEKILLTVPVGYPDPEGMKNFLEARDDFLKVKGLYEEKHLEIKDYSQLKGQTPRASRTIFIDYLKAEEERGYLQGFYGFNASFILMTLFNIGKSLYASHMPVMIYPSYEKAINEGLKTLDDPEKERVRQVESDLKRQKEGIKAFYTAKNYVDPLTANINELYTYINSINWGESESTEIKPLLELDHPFTKIYDALHVLKKDFEDTMEKQHRIEHALLKSNETMESLVQQRTRELAQKNTILETSLSILSHDTKNLFFNISYLIDQELEGPIRTLFKEFYDELYDNVMETTGYIKEKVRIFSLLEILGKIKVTAERTPLESHPRITLQFDGKPEMFYIETTTLFKNTITNIVENALKYTPQGKGIIVDIARISKDEGDLVRIDIIDHGKGIPDDEKLKIFEKGFRRESTKEIEGTGRGLWITKNIIEKAGGTLVVLDNPQGGSIFRIDVPAFKVRDYNESLEQLSLWFSVPPKIIRERAENLELLITMNQQEISDVPSFVFVSILNQLRLENKEKTQENIQHKLYRLQQKNPEGKSVLIVDDSLYVHYYLGTYFTDLGYRVVGFEFNGEKGVKAYNELKPDLITLDNNMPELCGKDAAKIIYQEHPLAKVIFITALGDSQLLQDEVRDLKDYDFHILTKPIKKEDLKGLLEELE